MIKPRGSILLVSKNEGTELSQDMYTVRDDEWKNLITCTVEVWTDKFNKWDIVITGKYSLYKLVYKWEDYFFINEEDIIGTLEN